MILKKIKIKHYFDVFRYEKHFKNNRNHTSKQARKRRIEGPNQYKKQLDNLIRII